MSERKGRLEEFQEGLQGEGKRQGISKGEGSKTESNLVVETCVKMKVSASPG